MDIVAIIDSFVAFDFKNSYIDETLTDSDEPYLLCTDRLQQCNTCHPSQQLFVPFSGHMLIGFKAEDDVSFELWFRGCLISTYTVEKGKFVYAIDDMFPAVMMCTGYSHFHVKVVKGNADSLILVYALWKPHVVRWISANKFYAIGCNKVYGFGPGMNGWFNLDTTEPPTDRLEWKPFSM